MTTYVILNTSISAYASVDATAAPRIPNFRIRTRFSAIFKSEAAAGERKATGGTPSAPK